MHHHAPTVRQIAPARRALLWVALAAVAPASACARRAETPPIPLMEGPRWSGTLSANGHNGHSEESALSGSAVVSPASNPDQSVAVVSVRGAAPGAHLPWHIHRGRCATGGPMVGPALSYEPLAPLADRTASRSATLPLTLPPGEPYYVDIHPSPDQTGVAVACGDLALVRVRDR
jgi:hypothetical protein